MNDPVNATDPDGESVLKPILKPASKSLNKQVAKRKLKAARSRGVRQAWREERQLVKSGADGTRDWTPAQRTELINNGKVKGFDGHHRNTVNGNPDLAADADNIEFLSSGSGGEHCCLHQAAGGTNQPISGQPLLDRSAGGTLPKLPARGFGSAGEIVGVVGTFLMSNTADLLDTAAEIPDPVSIYIDVMLEKPPKN